MENIKKEDIQKSAAVIANAMYDDPLHIYFFPNLKSRGKKIYKLYCFMVKINCGNTYKTSSGYEGIIIYEEPFRHGFIIWPSDFFRGLLLFFTIGLPSMIRLIKYQKWAEQIKNDNIREPYWYLNLVTVAREFRHKGFASKLIKPILALADENCQKVCLETQNPDNVPIYERYGFSTVSKKMLPGTDVIHYFMVRG